MSDIFPLKRGLLAILLPCAPLLSSTASAATEPNESVVPIALSQADFSFPQDADAQRFAAILRNTNKFALARWWTLKTFGNQSAAEFLDFGGKREVNIRPACEEAYALAVALRTGLYSAEITGIATDEAEKRTRRLIVSLAAAHLANRAGGWGDEWQSALWAGKAGEAGWLLWNKLGVEDQERVRRMVVHEADRFLDYRVPYYQDRAGKIVFRGDTKSEENAWNATILNLAVNMLPNHPHRAGWMAKSLELMVSSFARPSDTTREEVINGKPLSAWLNGSNSNEDGTVINHSIVHPDYMSAGLFEFNPAAVYALAGKPMPAAALFNVDVAYRAFTDLVFVAGASPYPIGGPIRPPGGTIYRSGTAEIYLPQGNDWGPARKMNFAYADVVARAFEMDKLSTIKAEVWERLHAEYALKMQSRFDDGHTYLDETEDKFHGREEWVAEKAASACLVKWLSHHGGVQITNDAQP